MRLFATGAMNWVMGRALPDDVPIEAKMVTKAIERAQNTVEGRNAESRKDVLKYDDVMNEQRKVIYRRRNQIIEGEDLHEDTIELLESTMTERGGLVVPVGVLRGVGPAPAGHRDHPVLPDQVRGRRSGRRHHGGPDHREHPHRGPRPVRRAGRDHPRRRGDGPPARARHHAADHRPAVAGPPGRDGLSPRGHQPPGHGQPGSAGGLPARGLRHVRQAHGRDQRRLPALRVPRPGADRAGRRARPRAGQLHRRRRPGPGGRRHLGRLRCGHPGRDRRGRGRGRARRGATASRSG